MSLEQSWRTTGPSISDPKLVALVEKLIDRVEKLEASSQPDLVGEVMFLIVKL